MAPLILVKYIKYLGLNY